MKAKRLVTYLLAVLSLFAFITGFVMMSNNNKSVKAEISTIAVDTELESKRQVISLDGMWECQDMAFKADVTELPEKFYNSIPVPGFWDMATIPFKYTSERLAVRENSNPKALWYKKVVTFSDEIDGRITLKIHKAYWGKTIYVNGEFVLDHQANFTPAYVDITDYVYGNGVENVILIKIGDKSTQDTNSGHPTGYDPEKSNFIPGIYDSVELILSGDPTIDYIQVAPDIHNSKATVKVTLSNNTKFSQVTDVDLTVTDSSDYLSTAKIYNVCVPAGETVEVLTTVDMSNFKYWSPSTPYLYNMTATTSADTITQRFGMREYYYDEEKGHSILNNEYYYILGTNVVFYRFIEDPLRGSLPWQEDWVRKVFAQFKSMNLNTVRFHCGFVPDFWYDICDEMGILVDDEFNMFGAYECQRNLYDNGEGVFLQEVKDWINERANHPCVIIWDIQNEVFDLPDNDFYPETGLCIEWAREQGLDLSNRPWDNGFEPADETYDSIEVHPYLFIDSNFKLSKLNGIDYDPVKSCNSIEYFTEGQSTNFLDVPDNPRIINEYSWLWISRDGKPCYLTEQLYSNLFPNGYTIDQIRYFYAKAVAQLTEFWRLDELTIGVMEFAGLSYSREGGHTSDNFLPDITNPAYHETFYKMVGDSFQNLMVCIEDWTETRPEGYQDVPVTLQNNSNETQTVEVSLRLYRKASSEHTFSYSDYEQASLVNETYTVEPGQKVTKNYNTYVPAGSGSYKLVASYTLNGKTVDSVRDFTLGAATPKVNATDSGTWAVAALTAGEKAGGTASGSNYVTFGNSITVTATVNDGYIFDGWKIKGKIVSKDLSYTFTPSQDTVAYAVFRTSYTYSISADCTEGGLVTGAGEFVEGQVANLYAVAQQGYIFRGWQLNGETVGTTAKLSVNANSSANYKAVFEQIKTYNVIAQQSVGGEVLGAGAYAEGSTATLRAVANSNYQFKEWQIDNETYSTNEDIKIVVNADTNVKAVFTSSQEITVDESTVANFNLKMIEGASIRYADPSGIRFMASFSKAKYQELVDLGYDVTVGMLIAPYDHMATKGDLTLYNANYTNANIVADKAKLREDGDNLIVQCALTNILDQNLTRQFNAVAYITVSDGTNSQTIYANANNNVRSIYEVAISAMTDSNYLKSDTVLTSLNEFFTKVNTLFSYTLAGDYASVSVKGTNVLENIYVPEKIYDVSTQKVYEVNGIETSMGNNVAKIYLPLNVNDINVADLTSAVKCIKETGDNAFDVIDDISNVVAVINKISQLPNVENVATTNQTVADQALTSFNALSDSEKALVCNYDKLCSVMNQISALKNVDAINQAISDLPAVADIAYQDKATIDGIKDMIDSLSEENKALITDMTKFNSCKEKADNEYVVYTLNTKIAQLKALDKIQDSHFATINEIEATYQTLTEEYQLKVNYADFEEIKNTAFSSEVIQTSYNVYQNNDGSVTFGINLKENTVSSLTFDGVVLSSSDYSYANRRITLNKEILATKSQGMYDCTLVDSRGFAVNFNVGVQLSPSTTYIDFEVTNLKENLKNSNFVSHTTVAEGIDGASGQFIKTEGGLTLFGLANSGWSGFDYFQFDAGETYKLSFDYKVLTGTASNWWCPIRFGGNGDVVYIHDDYTIGMPGNNKLNSQATISIVGDYAHVEAIFTSTSDTTHLEFPNWDGACNVLFDNILLTTIFSETNFGVDALINEDVDVSVWLKDNEVRSLKHYNVELSTEQYSYTYGKLTLDKSLFTKGAGAYPFTLVDANNRTYTFNVYCGISKLNATTYDFDLTSHYNTQDVAVPSSAYANGISGTSARFQKSSASSTVFGFFANGDFGFAPYSFTSGATYNLSFDIKILDGTADAWWMPIFMGGPKGDLVFVKHTGTEVTLGSYDTDLLNAKNNQAIYDCGNGIYRITVQFALKADVSYSSMEFSNFDGAVDILLDNICLAIVK